MAASKLNAKSPTIRRILREAAEISNSPSPDYTAEPLESDLFEWHFTLKGPPNSVYGEGVYHGRIILPSAYPLRPPNFRFMTPNGRFEANREICLSISGHHEETWQPAWGVRTALVALRSFMETDPRGQLGGLETTEDVRKHLAAESSSFKCPTCGKTNSEIIKECEERAQEAAGSSQAEVEIPKELNMGWKDELEAKKQNAAAGGNSDESEAAELAEGFVQTVPATVDNVVTSSSPEIHRAPPPVPVGASGAGPGNGLPTPTRPARTPVPVLRTTVRRRPVPAVAVHQPRRAADDVVPLWVDRTIVVLVVLLIALVLKVVFSG